MIRQFFPTGSLRTLVSKRFRVQLIFVTNYSVTANMEGKKLLRLLRSPLACGQLDKGSQIHAFIERFIQLTDICNPAAVAAKQKLEKVSSNTLLDSRAPASAVENDAAVSRPASEKRVEKRVALEQSVRGVWRETRLLCDTLGCHPPQPLSARQSHQGENSKCIEMALRECNRACMASGIGVDDAGLMVNLRAIHLTAFCFDVSWVMVS
jgi:hypothetical protein